MSDSSAYDVLFCLHYRCKKVVVAAKVRDGLSLSGEQIPLELFNMKAICFAIFSQITFSMKGEFLIIFL